MRWRLADYRRLQATCAVVRGYVPGTTTRVRPSWRGWVVIITHSDPATAELLATAALRATEETRS